MSPFVFFSFFFCCFILGVQLGLRMFLGVSGEVVATGRDDRSFSLILHANPLADFVDLPHSLSSLCYSNLICGVIRGALEQVCTPGTRV